VAAVVRNKYPESLTDVLDDTVISSGQSSLTSQLVCRVENVHCSTPSCQKEASEQGEQGAKSY